MWKLSVNRVITAHIHITPEKEYPKSSTCFIQQPPSLVSRWNHGIPLSAMDLHKVVTVRQKKSNLLFFSLCLSDWCTASHWWVLPGLSTNTQHHSNQSKATSFSLPNTSPVVYLGMREGGMKLTDKSVQRGGGGRRHPVPACFSHAWNLHYPWPIHASITVSTHTQVL